MIPIQGLVGVRNMLKSGSVGLLATCMAACAPTSAGPMKTEVLPADGGDLGKAYVEFASAVDAGDKARIAKLIDPNDADENPAIFQAYGKLSSAKPVGGRRQGDRATVFLQTATDKNQNYYALLNATYAGSGWQFDSPAGKLSLGVVEPGRDCIAKTQFPCALTTAPDSIVSGTVVLNKYDTFVYKKPPSFRMLDGFAVRVFDDDGKALQKTTVFLSSMGIIPESLTHDPQIDPDSVRYKLAFGLLRVDVAADGKTANVEFWNGGTKKEAKVADGLTIEVADGKRIRGRLKADIKDVAQLDMYFDVATASVYHPE